METQLIKEGNYSFSNDNDLKNYIKIDSEIFDFSNELLNFNQLDEIKKQFFDFTLKPHLKSFPPKEAFLIIPSQSEEFELDADKNIISRRIFEGKKGYLPNENEELQNLKSEIENYNFNNPQNKLEIPIEWPDHEIFKILQACRYEIKSTIVNLLQYVEFRKGYFPMRPTDKAIEILTTTGFLYCHGRDRSFRPILISRAESYLANVKKYSYDDWLNAIIYFSEYVIRHMMIPGQVETWNTIADLNNVSLLSLPTDFHKFVKFLQTNYRSRLNLSFVFGMNKFLDFIWRIVKNFLHANIVRKIIFLNETNKHLIYETILPEQLETKFGGTAKDLFTKNPNKQGEYLFTVDSLFPPVMPSNNFQTAEDKQKLINESEYISLAKQGLIAKLSPYIDFNQYELNEFVTCAQKTSRTKTIGEFSVYEDAMSHIYTKMHSENNLNNDNSQYDVCNDYRETYDNNQIIANKIKINVNTQLNIIKNKTEESEEYLDAAQNTDEQSNYNRKISSNNVDKFSPFGITSIFNDKNNLKLTKKKPSKEFELEVKNSSFDVDGNNKIQLLLLDRKTSFDQDDLIYSGKCFNCDTNSDNKDYCLKCVIDRKHIPKNNNEVKNIRDSSNTIYLRESNTVLNYVETGRSSPFLNKNNNGSNSNINTIEKARGGYTLPFEKQENFQYLSEPENTDASNNQRLDLRLESNTGANCCTNIDNKCLIF